MRECEKKLISLLTPKRIELIKVLVKQRHVVFYGILLKQAQSAAEVTQIEEQMAGSKSGRELLLEIKLEKASQAQRSSVD